MPWQSFDKAAKYVVQPAKPIHDDKPVTDETIAQEPQHNALIIESENM